MAEYSSSGIWIIGGIGHFRHGMIEYHNLKISDRLEKLFKEWILYYEKKLDGDFDVDILNADGLKLASELKSELGNAFEVRYAGEDADGSLTSEIEIL